MPWWAWLIKVIDPYKADLLDYSCNSGAHNPAVEYMLMTLGLQ